MEIKDQSRLQNVVLELEKRYPYFKKMDVYATVSDAYKKVHSFLSNDYERELEEVRKIADHDLRLSLN